MLEPINGLRAVAVILVLLYHFDFKVFGLAFSFGYIGVDIFFVISGFLITKKILAPEFSLNQFYTKRFFRIFPAMCIVVFLTTITSQIFLDENAAQQNFTLFEYVIMSVQNFYLASTMVEYGGPEAKSLALMHTWSLAIEIQIYLFFPLILSCLKNRFLFLIALSLTFSLASFYYFDHNTNYFLTQNRLSQFLLGSLASLNCAKIRHGSITGFWLVIFGLIAPNFASNLQPIAPVTATLGSALILASTKEKNYLNRCLGNCLLRPVGQLSYSLYLIHWPIIVMFSQSNQFSEQAKLIGLLTSILTSWILFTFIETPLRKPSTRNFSIVIVICIVLGAILILARSHSQPLLGLETDDNHRRASWQHLRSRHNTNPHFEPDSKRNVLVLGNSHAKDAYNMFQGHLEALNIDVIAFKPHARFQLSCLDETVVQFRDYRDELYRSDLYIDSDLILVSHYFLDETYCNPNDKTAGTSSDFIGLNYLAKRVESDGKQIVIMDQSPVFSKLGLSHPLTQAIRAESATFQKNFSSKQVRTGLSRQLFQNLDLAFVMRANAIIKKIASFESIPIISKIDHLCDVSQEECESLTPDFKKMYFDQHHLTVDGAKYLGKLLLDDPIVRAALVIPSTAHAEKDPIFYERSTPFD